MFSGYHCIVVVFLVKARVCMLYDAPLAIPLHRPVGVQGDPCAVLDVQLLQPSAGSRDGAHPGVADHLAAAHAHLLQLGAVDREHLDDDDDGDDDNDDDDDGCSGRRAPGGRSR